MQFVGCERGITTLYTVHIGVLVMRISRIQNPIVKVDFVHRHLERWIQSRVSASTDYLSSRSSRRFEVHVRRTMGKAHLASVVPIPETMCRSGKNNEVADDDRN